MKAYFAAQPWEGGRSALDFVRDASREVPGGELRIAVAWAKKSGMSTLAPFINQIRADGGSVQLITGLSAGGATKQGLELALQLCDSVHVVYDVVGPTFHPKVYYYRTPGEVRLLVGSNNLTAGGLFRNSEAALEVIHQGDDAGEPFDGVVKWMNELVADDAMALPLSSELLPKLLADPRYRIGDETVTAGSAGQGGAGTAAPKSNHPDLFVKSSRRRMYPGPAPRTGSSGSLAAGLVQGTPLEIEERVVLRIWSKKLSRSDALRSNPGSNTTGNLRLGKANWPINKETFFVNEFFAHLPWAPDDSSQLSKSSTVVPFQVVVDGVDQGVHNVKVDHAPTRVAGQNNVPTILHWGSLAPAVRDADHIGHYVILRSFADGGYSLEIKANPDEDELPPSTSTP